MSLPQDVVADGAGPYNPSTFAFSEPRLSMTADNMAARSTAMEERLSTFRPIKLATSLQLASAGFSYDEKRDTVKCSLCNLTVDRNGTPDPLSFHKKKSPTCSFFLPAGTKQASPSSLPMTNAASAASAKVPTPPATKKTNIPPSGKYPQYKDHPARVASFRGWPLEVVKQSPDYLAKCGFFYIGSADRVRCYFCGITLRNWEAEDDPYQEHRNWAPKCTFIQTLDRPERHPEATLRCAEVDAGPAAAGSSEQPDRGCLEHQGAAGSSQQHQHQHLNANANDKDSASCLGSHHSLSATSNNSSLPTKHHSSDIMLSPKVLAVIDMGFAREVVEKVVQQKFASESSEFADAIELYMAVEHFVSSH